MVIDIKVKKGFSLVELSIVILVIGILIASITKGKQIYHKVSLTAAQSITTSSIISTIPDLALWYETSLDSSFLKEEKENDSPISIWFDNNPRSVNSQKNNATQNNLNNQPKFIEKAIGSIPAIKFDGINDFLYFNGDFLVNSTYTLFVVEKRISGKSLNYFFGSGPIRANNTALHVGYRSDSVVTLAHYGYSLYDLDANTKAFASSPQPKIMTFMLDNEGKKIWLAGGDQPDSKAGQTAKIYKNTYFWIGSGFDTTFYQGYIAEILMFGRNLTTKERNSVENYLSKKYNIKLKN